MIFNIIAILCILACIYNFKIGFSLFIVFQVFWYQSTLLVLGGLNLTTYLFCPVMIYMIYLFKRSKLSETNKVIPYKVAFICTLISYIVTSICAYSGFVTEFMRSISLILRTYLIIWIAWNIFDSKKDFIYLYKLLTYVFLFAVLYGIFEYITHFNPILDYKIYLSNGTIQKYADDNLRGYRLTSIFEHPIGAGMNFGLYSMFTLCAWIKYREKLPNSGLAIITALLCLPCVLLTKMRSAIVFTAITALTFVDFKIFKKKRTFRLLILVVIALPFVWKTLQDNFQIIISIFNSSVRNNQVGGSSLAMRLEQLYAALQLMKMSPIGGLGETFKGLFVNQYTIMARELESIWLEQIAMHGIVGVISTIILIVSTTIVIPIHYRSKASFFLSLAYWLTYSLSSVPSFRIVLFYLAEFYFIKKTPEYKSSKNPKKRKRLSLVLKRK